MVRLARAQFVIALLTSTAAAHLVVDLKMSIRAPGAAWYALIQLPLYQRVNGIQLTSQRNVISGIQMWF